jgi:hypothetical protein
MFVAQLGHGKTRGLFCHIHHLADSIAGAAAEYAGIRSWLIP